MLVGQDGYHKHSDIINSGRTSVRSLPVPLLQFAPCRHDQVLRQGDVPVPSRLALVVPGGEAALHNAGHLLVADDVPEPVGAQDKDVVRGYQLVLYI